MYPKSSIKETTKLKFKMLTEEFTFVCGLTTVTFKQHALP